MKRAIVMGAVALTGILAAAVPAQAGASTGTSSYVVMVKDGLDPAQVATADGVAPTQVWDEVGGFAAELTDKQVNRLRADSSVESVEVDGVAASIPHRSSAPVPQPAQMIKAAVRRVGGLESPTAKIDGIDERIDVDIAILDGGIQPDHPDLNVAGGHNCVGKGKSWKDRDGHGTMVSGFAAALDNDIGIVGIAPGARLWAIRVADPDGLISDSALLCGLNWAIKHADEIEVANMSLAGDENDLVPCGTRPRPRSHEARIHDAICKLTRKGVTAVASAGNYSMDATTFSPAGYPEVIAVSAMADYDGLPGGLAATPSVCHPDDWTITSPPSPTTAPRWTSPHRACASPPRSSTASTPTPRAPASLPRSWPERPRCTCRRTRTPGPPRCVKCWWRGPNRDRSPATPTPIPRACSTSADSDHRVGPWRSQSVRPSARC